jgi:mercuric ion transport protein
MKTFSSIGISILTALGSSLCCIIPTISIVAGTSSLATSLSWLQPYRPYFISGVVLTLGFAWYSVLFPKKEEACNCETSERKSFFKSKTFLGLTTVVAVLLITFPSYSRLFLTNPPIFAPSTRSETVTIPVSGMTCSGCELQVEEEVKTLEGIILVKASHTDKNTIVQFDQSKVNLDKIVEAINKTHYKATNPITRNDDRN